MQLRLFSRNTSLQVSSRKRTKKTPVAAPASGNLWTQQEDAEKEMALLFLDIRNFSGLTETHVAADIIQIIKKIFARFQNIIRNHHGRIVETTGDGFYAAFGFDRNSIVSANDAVAAAYAILKTLEGLNEDSFEKNLQRRIEIGIGLHSGRVATGTMQIGLDEHTIVMGHAVNIASRIQDATKMLNNNFIISSEVFRVLVDPPTDKQHVMANLKGVANPVGVHLIGKRYA